MAAEASRREAAQRARDADQLYGKMIRWIRRPPRAGDPDVRLVPAEFARSDEALRRRFCVGDEVDTARVGRALEYLVETERLALVGERWVLARRRARPVICAGACPHTGAESPRSGTGRVGGCRGFRSRPCEASPREHSPLHQRSMPTSPGRSAAAVLDARRLLPTGRRRPRPRLMRSSKASSPPLADLRGGRQLGWQPVAPALFTSPSATSLAEISGVPTSAPRSRFGARAESSRLGRNTCRHRDAGVASRPKRTAGVYDDEAPMARPDQQGCR